MVDRSLIGGYNGGELVVDWWLLSGSLMVQILVAMMMDNSW